VTGCSSACHAIGSPMKQNCPPEHTAGWGPGRKCHCPTCHKNFSVISHFDKHRPKGECLSPESIGLELNAHGVWRKPGEVDYAERLPKGKTQ
jgi:hypothetical protein